MLTPFVYAQTVDNEKDYLVTTANVKSQTISEQLNNNVPEPSDTIKTRQLYLLTKNDGVEYIGFILSDDGREVLIETEKLGKIYIPKSEIKSIAKIEDKKSIVLDEYYASGPFTTRYAFTTNALPIKKGENYSILNLYGPEVHFALTNKFNIGIMSTWIGSPFIIATKYTIKTKNEKINLSLGTLMGTSGYINNFKGFGGLHFGNITLGDAKKNITLAVGYMYIQTGSSYAEPGNYVDQNTPYQIINNPKFGQYPTTKGPIFSLAGILKVGSKASFVFDGMIGVFNSIRNHITENVLVQPNYYNIPYTPGSYQHIVENTKTQAVAMLLMPGMRFQTTEKKAFQISLAGISIMQLQGFENSKNFSFPMPMCSWFYKF